MYSQEGWGLDEAQGRSPQKKRGPQTQVLYQPPRSHCQCTKTCRFRTGVACATASSSNSKLELKVNHINIVIVNNYIKIHHLWFSTDSSSRITQCGRFHVNLLCQMKNNFNSTSNIFKKHISKPAGKVGKKASQKIAWKLFSQSFLKIGDLWRPNTKKTEARQQQDYDIKYFGNLQTNSHTSGAISWDWISWWNRSPRR